VKETEREKHIVLVLHYLVEKPGIRKIEGREIGEQGLLPSGFRSRDLRNLFGNLCELSVSVLWWFAMWVWFGFFVATITFFGLNGEASDLGVGVLASARVLANEDYDRWWCPRHKVSLFVILINGILSFQAKKKKEQRKWKLYIKQWI